ncbi:hypothetical protein SELR_13850 [Selenomonas ruminantium subsp. lactilytica TAM6421]|uniref:AAA domain (Dynein-related subfamily) n=1 Tax=Selenomonas ruminantium subsp. lactilytica (strain NBRC 103574 / TAM6421) TaxID=927704 RepID=I0GQQ6_SELRL|nr:hypothetical protein [Selenomonas ruminantium]BAL83093.1 hypothetical protein SELR_13850 [Selenomonas ruminantium subsp. lactilytica TAM6421]
MNEDMNVVQIDTDESANQEIISPVDKDIPSHEESPTEKLKNWEKELAAQRESLAEEKKDIAIREARVQSREDILAEKEKKTAALACELAKREESVVDLEQKREEISRSEKELSSRSERLNVQQAAMDERQLALDALQAELTKKEQEIQAQAAKRQAEELGNLRTELEKIRQQRISELEAELEHIRKAAADEAEKLRQGLDADINTRRQRLDEEMAEKRSQLAQEIKEQRDSLEAEQKQLFKEKEQLETEKKTLEFDRKRTKKLEDTLKARQDNIEAEVSTASEEYRQSLDKKLEASRLENEHLRAELKNSESLLANYNSFQAVYGDNPDILRKKMADLRAAYDSLQDELGKRPGQEVQQECERLKAENARLQNDMVVQEKQFGNMQQQVVELEKMRNNNVILQASNESLHAQWTEAQDIIKNQAEQLKRLTATEVTPADREARAQSLREPYLERPFVAPVISKADASVVSELEWLTGIENACKDYGISFPRRVLYAFHTSLKIANWSTITVLAGVSGTGKSELPRLYSAFGGLNFISVPVQPNWDSQESMLGFFNSIDNKFDAQPVLRFLVECTEQYDNNMAVVLLDEMNLAHVEHYFADFLSKLETRRSAPDDNLPKIYVNLGAGVKPYELPLKRNILWCGTMNQDETTKSLSDKVLDRGIVINFPRPRHLKDRQGARNIDTFCEKRGIAPLSRQVWNAWRVTNIQFQDKQTEKLNEYRSLLEKMNDHLSTVGRAIGHRVWQAIAHYVVNYPTVRAAFNEANGELTDSLELAMHTAVEDQIVQKVMPKLRGIDTRGKSYDNCLSPIKGLLNEYKFNLENDFTRACEMGYGQFMWGSAEYIEDDNGDEQELNDANQ